MAMIDGFLQKKGNTKEADLSILSMIFRFSEPSPSDPIDHPDLRRMTQRELADLPFPRDPMRSEGWSAASEAERRQACLMLSLAL
jgi:hypothetical protein